MLHSSRKCNRQLLLYQTPDKLTPPQRPTSIDEEQQAQGFTTGTTPYNLTTVGFNIRNAAPDTADTFTVSIQGASGGNPDGIDLASQEVTTESTTGTTTVDFTSANIVLKPSTTYFVVFTYDGDAADTVALQTTDADAEDAGGQPGVTINNTFHHIHQ